MGKIDFYQVPKVVTCHAGARDHYQLSQSFDEVGLLDGLVTDFYTPDWLRCLLNRRFNGELDSKKVRSSWADFIGAYLFKNYSRSNNNLSIKAAQRALKNKSNFFACSYTASAGFEYLKNFEFKPRKYLFQLHPHPEVILNILNREVFLGKATKSDLSYEAEFNSLIANSLIFEAALADEICVASTFTKKSLVSAGIELERVHVIPYGVDSRKFSRLEPKKINSKLKILFCGQFIQRKGISYLYDALLRFDHRHYELIIVTRGDCESLMLEKFQKNLNVRVHLNVAEDVLIGLMHQSDVFILPSLYEGFGHVILEAMSAGLPVITTVNTAAVDVFDTGKEGFIGPIGDADFLCEKIEYFMRHPSALNLYGNQAALTAQKYSWDVFRIKISNFYIKSELKHYEQGT